MSAATSDTDIRSMTMADVEAAALVAFEAHGDVSSRLGVPSEHPTLDFSRGLIGAKAKDPHAIGWVAERKGRLVGSVFLNDFGVVAAIGPLTVHPTEGTGAGRALMETAVKEAGVRGRSDVRLVQSPSQLSSLALYIKLGFNVREPLVLVQGTLLVHGAMCGSVRPATEADVARCHNLAEHVIGVARDGEVRHAIAHGTATVLERGDDLLAYATGVGLRGHAVALSDETLVTLLAHSHKLPGPGFFAPLRNAVLVKAALASGMTFAWPAMLMTNGRDVEPRGAFIPSIAF